MASDDEEYVQLTVNEVFVYKIPPRTSAQGHRAADWKEQVWVGKLLVVTRGTGAAVKLIGADGKTFAVAPVRRDGPPAAEKVSDSSRYFVLRIENDKGQHAFIGIGFNQRSDAFDFNVALSDCIKQAEIESGVSTALDKLNLGPAEDFSLKEGQTFSIKVNVGAGAAKKPASTATTGKLAAPGGIGKLRAPGTSSSGSTGTGASARPAATQSTSASAADDLLGLDAAFGNVSSTAPQSNASSSASKSSATAKPSTDSDWVAF